NTQIGCELGRLETFRRQGIEVVEAADPPPDQGGPEVEQAREFFVVSGRACGAYRDEAWAAQTPPRERAAKVRQASGGKVDALPVVDSKTRLDDLKDTITGLAAQIVKPHCTWLIHTEAKATGDRVLELIDLMVESGLEYRVKRVTPRDGREVPAREAVDMAVA